MNMRPRAARRTLVSWFLRNATSPGPADLSFAYGPANGTPVAGDWNGL